MDLSSLGLQQPEQRIRSYHGFPACPATSNLRGQRLASGRGTQKAEQGPGRARGAQGWKQALSLSENSIAGREMSARETERSERLQRDK